MNRSRVVGIVLLVAGLFVTAFTLPRAPWIALGVVAFTFFIALPRLYSNGLPPIPETGSPADPTETERRLRAALIQAERADGPDHLSLCGPLAELAGLLQSHNRFDEAEVCLHRAIEVVDGKREPGDRANTLRVRLGELHLESGRFEAAEAAFREGFADPGDFPPDHRIARRFSLAGAVWLGRNRPREALALQRRAAELFETAGHARVIESVETFLECAALTQDLEPGADVKPWMEKVRKLTADQPRLRRKEMADRLAQTLRQSIGAGRSTHITLVSQTLTALRTAEAESNENRRPLESLLAQARTAEIDGDAGKAIEFCTRVVSTFDADPQSHETERGVLIEALTHLCAKYPDDPARLVALSDRYVAEKRLLGGSASTLFAFLVSSALYRAYARDLPGAWQRLDEADGLLAHCDNPDGLALYFSLSEERFCESQDWDGLDRFYRSRIDRLEIHERSPEFLFRPMLRWIEMLTDRMRLDEAGRRLVEAEAMCAAPHAPRDAYVQEAAVCARFLRISGKLDEAELEGEAALNLATNLSDCGKPLHAAVLVGLAETKRRLGKLNEAANLLESARAIGDSPTAVFVLAQVRCDQGRLEEADRLSLEGMTRAEKERAVDGTALHTRGIVLAAMGRFDDADAMLSRAREIDSRRFAPNHPDVLETAAALERVRRR